MNKDKRERLEAGGWRVGDAADFLGLTPEEAAFVELKVALAIHLRQIRKGLGLTQSQAAARLGSSQSRVARMEAADVSVSLDLLMRSLLALGVSRSELAKVISQAA